MFFSRLGVIGCNTVKSIPFGSSVPSSCSIKGEIESSINQQFLKSSPLLSGKIEDPKKNWVHFVLANPNASNKQIYKVYKATASTLPAQMRKGSVKYKRGD